MCWCIAQGAPPTARSPWRAARLTIPPWTRPCEQPEQEHRRAIKRRENPTSVLHQARFVADDLIGAESPRRAVASGQDASAAAEDHLATPCDRLGLVGHVHALASPCDRIRPARCLIGSEQPFPGIGCRSWERGWFCWRRSPWQPRDGTRSRTTAISPTCPTE